METLIIQTEWKDGIRETYKLLALDKDAKGFIQCLWESFHKGDITKITLSHD